jgi:hypothetical protein
VCASPCPILSAKGCDELYPEKIPTNSFGLYASPAPPGAEGIIRARKILCSLHAEMASRGFVIVGVV